MKLILAEPKLLSDPISIMSDIVNEVKLKVNKDFIEIIAMDPANVIMVIFKLFGSAFTEYSVDKKETLGINLENLKRVLRRARPNDVLILELVNNRLKIILKGENNKTFNLSLIDIDEDEQKVPELNFPVKIELDAGVFDESVEDASIVAESVALIADNKNFSIKSEGNLSDAVIEFSQSDDLKVVNNGGSKVNSRYSVEYLKKIVKGSKLSDKALIYFNKDYPLKVDYNLVDKLSLSFILAPRISND